MLKLKKNNSGAKRLSLLSVNVETLHFQEVDSVMHLIIVQNKINTFLNNAACYTEKKHRHLKFDAVLHVKSIPVAISTVCLA